MNRHTPCKLYGKQIVFWENMAAVYTQTTTNWVGNPGDLVEIDLLGYSAFHLPPQPLRISKIMLDAT